MALAVAAALRALHGYPLDPREDAALLDRGARSGIGIGIFEQGGLVVDGGRDDGNRVPPIISRLKFPARWRALLVLDDRRQGMHGVAERQAFRELIKISGVGPRTALSILSGMGVADLAQAISLQEAGRLVKVPGIGKKTAERLLLELKGKLGADIGVRPGAGASDAQADILQALLALGYNDKEAAAALKALPADVGVSDGIKLALKALAR